MEVRFPCDYRISDAWFDHVQTVVVIGKNIDRDDAAYDAIVLFGVPTGANPCALV